MKKTFLFLLISIPLIVVPAQDFEGVINFTMDESSPMEYFTKGEMVRMQLEMPGMKMAIVVNSKTGAAFMLMTESKVYMEMNLKDLPAPKGAEEDIDFQKTGKTVTILGYTCEQVLIRQRGMEVEMWVTKGLGRFVHSNFNAGPKSPAVKKIEDELTSKGYFPLRMISKSEDQGEFRMEALSVTRKPLKKDLFVIPNGFTKIQMPPRQ
ncbi:MAG: DUF4412 domain-containing protein [Bacteroidota bacterium]